MSYALVSVVIILGFLLWKRARDLADGARELGVWKARAYNFEFDCEHLLATNRHLRTQLQNIEDALGPVNDEDVVDQVQAPIHHMKRQGHDVVDLSAGRATTERDERLAEAKLSMDCAVAHPAGCDCLATYQLFRRVARLPRAEAVSA